MITWILVSLFLALALNPAVDWFMRHGIKRRGQAAGLTYVLALAAIAAIGYAVHPDARQPGQRLRAGRSRLRRRPDQGRGRLGFLETKYHIVEKIRERVNEGGASRVLGLTGAAISITKSVVSLVLATITIAFLTFFMLLEGPAGWSGFFGLLPEESQPRWRRVGHDIYRTVGGYVTGTSRSA